MPNHFSASGAWVPRSLVPRGLAALLCAVALAACRPSPPALVSAPPVESLLELAAEVRRHSLHDFYQRPWPRDAGGLNPFRAGLVRIANIETLHPGEQQDALAFLRGECLMLLRDYEAAAREFARCAAMPGDLRQPALDRRAAMLAFHRAIQPAEQAASLEDALGVLDDMREATRLLVAQYPDPPLRTLALLENEQADVAHARFLTEHMAVTEGGPAEAVEAWEGVIERHATSYRVMRHRLALGSLYERLAHDYLERHPPETQLFEQAVFLRVARLARDEFIAVAVADGFRERPIGQGRLAALNALIQDVLQAAE